MDGVRCESVLSPESTWSLSNPAPGESAPDACECCASPRHKVKITRKLSLSAASSLQRRLSISISNNKINSSKSIQTGIEAAEAASAIDKQQLEEEPEPQQSPIDIHEDESEHVPTYSCPNAIAIAMGEGEAELAHNDHGFSVQWTSPGANALVINGKRFRAVQFHFHTPSEHTLDGVHEELEMHLVHQAADGTLAVLGVLFREGDHNAFLGQFWDALPRLHQAGESHTIPIPLGTIDPRALDVAQRSFFRYRGSLTTPPYTEGVEWVVIHDVMEASREQLDVFHSALPGTNARDLQPLNHRHVWLAC